MGMCCSPKAWTWIAWRTRRCKCGELTTERSSLEQVETLELAGALAPIVFLVVSHRAARIVFFGIDIDGAGPVFRWFNFFETAAFVRGLPVFEIHLFNRAIEVLQLDRAIVFIEGDDLERITAQDAVPVADGGFHRIPPNRVAAMLLAPFVKSTSCCSRKVSLTRTNFLRTASCSNRHSSFSSCFSWWSSRSR